MSQLSEMFERLSVKGDKVNQQKVVNVGEENMQNLQRIVLLEQEVERLKMHIKNIYEQDRQLKLALKSNKILNHKDLKV